MLTEHLNARRYQVSAVGTMLVLLMLTVATASRDRLTPMQLPLPQTFELTTAVLPVVTPPEPAPLQPVRPTVEALARTPQTPRVLPSPATSPPPLDRTGGQPLVSLPTANDPDKLAALPAAVAMPVAPPAAAPLPPAEPAPPRIPEPIRPTPPAEIAPAPPGVEGPFTAQLRAQLNASKRYPTGREASLQRPTGRVVVWFTLARSGSLTDAGIEDSSNSILLDNAALSTVRRASFPALPEAAWPGQPSRKFTATIDFVPPT